MSKSIGPRVFLVPVDGSPESFVSYCQKIGILCICFHAQLWTNQTRAPTNLSPPLFILLVGSRKGL